MYDQLLTEVKSLPREQLLSEVTRYHAHTYGARTAAQLATAPTLELRWLLITYRAQDGQDAAGRRHVNTSLVAAGITYPYAPGTTVTTRARHPLAD
jgi:hypothetical protein